MAENVSAKRTEVRGYLDGHVVRRFTFWTTTVCLMIAVVATLLAIWRFTGTDTLWRTVATSLVVGAGALTFSWINGLFGESP